MNYDITIRFIDSWPVEVEGTYLPRRTFYRASLVRGPFAVPGASLKEFQRKDIQSPTIDTWENGPLEEPVHLMDDAEALRLTLEMIINLLQP